MGQVSISGQDVIQLDQRLITNLADGDCGALSFEEDLMSVKAAKNGNRLYASKQGGLVMGLTIRVLLGSPDDKWLNSRFQEQLQDPANFKFLAASVSKRVGDGTGSQNTVVYQGSGGVFQKGIDAKTNSDGDTDQSVATYTLKFGTHSRSVQ